MRSQRRVHNARDENRIQVSAAAYPSDDMGAEPHLYLVKLGEDYVGAVVRSPAGEVLAGVEAPVGESDGIRELLSQADEPIDLGPVAAAKLPPALGSAAVRSLAAAAIAHAKQRGVL